jgi:hypothetical protein
MGDLSRLSISPEAAPRPRGRLRQGHQALHRTDASTGGKRNAANPPQALTAGSARRAQGGHGEATGFQGFHCALILARHHDGCLGPRRTDGGTAEMAL